MRRIVLLLLVLLGTAVADKERNKHKKKLYDLDKKHDPWTKKDIRFIAYGATMFNRPNCTGWIDKGPYVNFGCNDRCYLASGAMSVMLEGDYYEWFPRIVGSFYWRKTWKNPMWAKYRIPGFKWDSEQDGPMVFTYDFSQCSPEAIMDRVMIPNEGTAICYTFSRPVYSFNLKLQRLCDYHAEISDGGGPKDPRDGIEFDEGDKDPGNETWSGQGPKQDGRPAPPKDAQVPGENDSFARPPHMHGGTGPGSGMRRWTLGKQGDWGKDEREARKYMGGERQHISRELKNEMLHQRFFDDWAKPERDEDKAEPLDHAYSRAPGVIWGDMARDQVGFWGVKWEEKAPGNAAKKMYDAAVLGYAQCKKCYKEAKKQVKDAAKEWRKAERRRQRKAGRRQRKKDKLDLDRGQRDEKKWLEGDGPAETITKPGNATNKGPWIIQTGSQAADAKREPWGKTKPQWKMWHIY
ncbi:hypothetical protein CDD81_7794 [Ophiocordyceps australis]|uniref:Uncharacterized protein n=1 Tax=Ophiocordyceps australis TaxID=1399860 RepID=A0A2C5Y2H2_9HYPO|nr:hypothetical protein CDD81_7794 [Ophiocordyceps australis]